LAVGGGIGKTRHALLALSAKKQINTFCDVLKYHEPKSLDQPVS
jgi:hypothetical protein